MQAFNKFDRLEQEDLHEQLKDLHEQAADIAATESPFEDEAEAYQTRIEKQARTKAEKLIKKERRELARLKKHAGECLLKNNFAGYSYAIKKLRKFYRQPYTDDLITAMWNSSRLAIVDIANKALDDISK